MGRPKNSHNRGVSSIETLQPRAELSPALLPPHPRAGVRQEIRRWSADVVEEGLVDLWLARHQMELGASATGGCLALEVSPAATGSGGAADAGGAGSGVQALAGASELVGRVHELAKQEIFPRVCLPGPFGQRRGGQLSLYVSLLELLAEVGTTWVQFDEPELGPQRNCPGRGAAGSAGLTPGATAGTWGSEAGQWGRENLAKVIDEVYAPVLAECARLGLGVIINLPSGSGPRGAVQPGQSPDAPLQGASQPGPAGGVGRSAGAGLAGGMGAAADDVTAAAGTSTIGTSTTDTGWSCPALVALATLPGVHALSLDLTAGFEPSGEEGAALEDKLVVAGVVPARNLGRTDLEEAWLKLVCLGAKRSYRNALHVGADQSLEGLPLNVAAHPEIDFQVRTCLAFADEKQGEILALATALREGKEAVAGLFAADQVARAALETFPGHFETIQRYCALPPGVKVSAMVRGLAGIRPGF